MKGENVLLYRYVPILCALAALAAVSILVGRGTEKIQRIETLNEASVVEEPVPKVAQLVAQGGSIEEPETAAEKRQFPKKEEMEMRIGGFEPPKRVPSYEIVEDEPVDRDGAKAARLLVDTQVTSKEDFTLISRDIKSKYKDLDALSVSFLCY
jgi:hypothetical protein